MLLHLTCLLSEDGNGAYEHFYRKKKAEQLIRLMKRWLLAAALDDATSVDKEAAAAAARTLQVLCDRGNILRANI